MSGDQLARCRMHNVGLAGPPWPRVVDVVRRLGAVQAQEFGPALWSIRQRLGDGHEPELLALFDPGDLVRTHVLRPTWHFVAPEDVRWMLELTAPRVHAFNAYYYRKHELDDEVLATCHRLIGAALAGGRSLTRAELAAALAAGGVAAHSLRLGLILMHAELEQLICSGPRRGKQHTYSLLVERLPAVPRRSRDAALAELSRRYFTSHGPATLKDFACWSRLTMADVRRGIELAREHLDSRQVEGVTYWHGAGDPPDGGRDGTGVQLMQPYDEYVVAYSESKPVADRAGLAAHRPEQGAYLGIVLRDTQLAGFWKRTTKNATVVVDVQLYEPPDGRTKQALHAAVAEHGHFLGRDGVLAEPTSLLPRRGRHASAAV